jgi:hypothetical protein
MTGGVHLSAGREDRAKAARLEASSCGGGGNLAGPLALTTGSAIYSNSFLFKGVSFMDFSARLWVPYACFTSPIPRVTYVPFDSKRIRLASKSTPLILRFNLRHSVF